MKNSKGITLVALVITIIVLLILAGITITFVLGENGIIERAKQSGKDYAQAENNEKIDLANLNNQLEEIGTTSRGDITISQEEYNQLKQANSMSTEEVVIGTYIDGKPLYKKTVVLDINQKNSQTYNHNIENVDNIFVDTGNTFMTSSNNVAPFLAVGVSGETTADFANIYLSYIQTINKTYIGIRAGSSSTYTKAYVTLKYTKTTDVAK